MSKDVLSENGCDLKAIRQNLDERLFSLARPKEVILEYLAMKKLEGNPRPILCLVGPHGIGKRTLIRCMAEALRQEVVPIPIGSRPAKEMRIGEVAARIVQSSTYIKKKNPVFLLEGIDKLNPTFQGETHRKLIEVIELTQDYALKKEELENTIDVSRAIFIATATNLASISAVLLNQMEIVEIEGYTEEEKVRIALGYIVPAEAGKSGLSGKLDFSAGAIVRIIRNYTRESGVERLSRLIRIICGRLAREQVEAGTGLRFELGAEDVPGYLGAAIFDYPAARIKEEIGAVTVLGYSENGGFLLDLEVLLIPGKGKRIFTGNLDRLFQESAMVAVDNLRSRQKQLGIEEDFHTKYDIHFHMLNGKIPKHGVSAGLAILCALFSALTKRPIKAEIGLSGEITLHGKVLGVGNIREKVMAAVRSGLKTVIIPEENKKDLKGVLPGLSDRLDIVFVDDVESAIKSVFSL